MKRTPESIAKQVATMKAKYGDNIPGTFKKGCKCISPTKFKKGDIPWNKDKEFKQREKHPNWKGGITPIEQSIRDMLENERWKRLVSARDGIICQECGYENPKNEVHHIERLADMIREFLYINKKLNPKNRKDKEKLLVLAKDYKPFWDVNNGVVLCKGCHDTKRDWMVRDSKGRFV